MNKLVTICFIIVASGCAQQIAVQRAQQDPNVPRPIEYTVTLLNDSQLLVAVEMMGDVDRGTHLILPDRPIRDFRLNTQWGQLVPVDGTDKEVGIFMSDAAYKVKFHYIIDLPGRGEAWTGTYWDGTTLYLTGRDIWAFPYSDRPNDVSIIWKGFTGRSGAHSIAGSASRQRDRLTVDQFRETMHIIGDARHRRDINVSGTSLTVWGLGDVDNLDELSVTAATLLGEARSYWHDRALRRYLLIITGSNIGLTAGRAYHQGSLAVADKNVAGTIAHEMVHQWVPWPAIKKEKWLTEGFTEHVAQLLLMSSGLGSPADYAKHYNQVSWGHHGGTHPAERDVRHPYEVGFMLAHHWRSTQQAPSRVDSLLRGLVDRNTTGKELQGMVVEYLGPRAWEDVERYIDAKHRMPVPDGGDCFEVTVERDSSSDVRFPRMRPRASECALFDFE